MVVLEAKSCDQEILAVIIKCYLKICKECFLQSNND